MGYRSPCSFGARLAAAAAAALALALALALVLSSPPAFGVSSGALLSPASFADRGTSAEVLTVAMALAAAALSAALREGPPVHDRDEQAGIGTETIPG